MDLVTYAMAVKYADKVAAKFTGDTSVTTSINDTTNTNDNIATVRAITRFFSENISSTDEVKSELMI